MSTKTNDERTSFWNQLMVELPHWLDYLKKWEIPADMVADRFGVRHYHHDDIVEAIEGLSPETKLFNMLEAFYRGHPYGFRGTATDLETLLTADAAGCQYEARKLFSYTNACARYLERLSRRFGTIIRRDGRENNRHIWRIDFRAGDDDQNSCPVIGPEVMAVAA